MGLQTIIDKTSFLTIDKRKGAGFTVSRSGHIKTSVQQGSLYRFTVGAPEGLKYSENRGLLETLDSLDITEESNVDIGDTNTNLSYITEVKGTIDSPDTGAGLVMVGHSGSDLYINFSGASGSGTILKKGDFIQPKGNTSTYRYPYQITSDISATTNANVTVSVHRPVLEQDGVALTSGGVRLGQDCRFHLICANMPTYSVVPHDLIEFTKDFELIERLT